MAVFSELCCNSLILMVLIFAAIFQQNNAILLQYIQISTTALPLEETDPDEVGLLAILTTIFSRIALNHRETLCIENKNHNDDISVT